MDLTRLEERLDSIESRLKTIENKLWINVPSIKASPTPSPTTESTLKTTQQTHDFFSKPANWLGVIGIICFIFAAVFIIKLSIESGWLTHARQICLSALFGFAVMGAGLALLKSDREYASYLPAAGIIILYITTFAAHQIYYLISFNIAVAITGLVSGLCILLYLKVKHDIYPFIAAIGAYVTPVMFEFNSIAIFTLYYFVCCSLAFAVISIWLRSRMLTMISAYLAIITSAFIGLDLHQDSLIAIVLTIHFIIFSVATYLYTYRSNQLLTSIEAWSFFPVLMIFYAANYYFIFQVYPEAAPWISLGFAGFIAALYLFAKFKFSNRELKSQPMILAFITLISFHSIYLELLPAEMKPWLFVLIVLGFALSSPAAKINLKNVLIPALAILIILTVEYGNMLNHLLFIKENIAFSWYLVSLFSFINLWLLFSKKRKTFFKDDEFSYVLLAITHLLGIAGLYHLANPHGSLAVSASWLLYATGVICVAFIRKDQVMAKSALFVLLLSAGKALLYDAAEAPTLVRILCLLLTGAVLYGSGFMIKKISNWKK
ncbi:MAG: DUF2339 domain-containing protein [Gammaproteobacteria bacterium]